MPNPVAITARRHPAPRLPTIFFRISLRKGSVQWLAFYVYVTAREDMGHSLHLSRLYLLEYFANFSMGGPGKNEQGNLSESVYVIGKATRRTQAPLRVRVPGTLE